MLGRRENYERRVISGNTERKSGSLASLGMTISNSCRRPEIGTEFGGDKAPGWTGAFTTTGEKSTARNGCATGG